MVRSEGRDRVVAVCLEVCCRRSSCKGSSFCAVVHGEKRESFLSLVINTKLGAEVLTWCALVPHLA